MKSIVSIFCLLTILSSCNQKSENADLRSQIDSLKSVIAKTYKPGLGEFMSSIQIHHEKLWFAGQNNNWDLADFEMNEIKEALQGIKDYCNDRPEVRSITMIDPAIDSITVSIQQKDLPSFTSGFILLTGSCNNCHKETNHGFNVIKIPESPPFSNQAF